MSPPRPAAPDDPVAIARVTICLCFLVAMLEGMELQAAGVAAPQLGPEFGLDPQQLGWFFSIGLIGLLAGAVLGGGFADWIGRRPALIGSIFLFGMFSLATAWAWGFESLMAARLLTGVGLGSALPNLIALVAENSPVDRRKQAVTLMYAGMPLGGVIASATTLLNGSFSGWRILFIGGGLASLFIMPALLRWLPESSEYRSLRQTPAPGEGKRPGLWCVLFGEGRGVNTVLLWGSYFFTLLVLYLLVNWLPSMLVSRGFTKPQAAVIQVAFNLGGALGSIGIGRLMDRPARRPTVVFSYVAVVASLGLLAITPTTMPLAFLVGLFGGAAVIGTQGIIYALAPGCYPTAIRGTGVGVAVAIGRTGSIGGPLLAATLFGAGHNAAQVLLGIMPFVLFGAVGATTLVWRTSQSDPDCPKLSEPDVLRNAAP